MNPLYRLLARSLPYVPRPIVRRVASPYVAGETVAEAFRVVRALSGSGLASTLDILGEDVTERRMAESAADAYRALLDAIAEAGLHSNVSLKLSQFGLKLDPKLCADLLRAVVEHARLRANFVRIDMEDSSTTDAIPR